MKKRQLLEILDSYCKLLDKEGRKPVRFIKLDKKFENSDLDKNKEAMSDHILWMCLEMKRFVKEDQIEKANRWLGFIQGCF